MFEFNLYNLIVGKSSASVVIWHMEMGEGEAWHSPMFPLNLKVDHFFSGQWGFLLPRLIISFKLVFGMFLHYKIKQCFQRLWGGLKWSYSSLYPTIWIFRWEGEIISGYKTTDYTRHCKLCPVGWKWPTKEFGFSTVNFSIYKVSSWN